MASVVLMPSSQPSVKPFLLHQLHSRCQEYPQPSVPNLRELSQWRPRSSSGGSASHFIHRLVNRVHSFLTALSSTSVPRHSHGQTPVSHTRGTQIPLVPSIISHPITPDHLGASGPHHQVHLSHQLSIHTGTVFPPPAQSAHWQQS